MHNLKVTAAISALAICVVAGCARQATDIADDGADLLLTNGRFYTLNQNQPWADAVAISNGRIIFVGSANEAASFTDDDTAIVDLHGKFTLPGFQDPHSHFAFGGVSYTICPIYDLPDRDTIFAEIKKCADADPEADIIRGTGWTIDQFDNGMPPTKEMLDAIDVSRPLVFGDADGHAFWLNSKAFEVYDITNETADPDGGKIERNPDTGEIWGTLHEETAMKLVTEKWPPFTDDEFAAGLEFAQDYHHSIGITALTEAMIKLEGNDYSVTMNALQQFNDEGKLKIRVLGSLLWDAEQGMDQIERFKQAREEYSNDRLQVNSVKFWADGVIETYTAMMLEPYSDRPETHGILMVPREQLMEAAPLVDAEKFQIHIHAIGDATVRYGLDAIEAAWDANGRRDARHQITHAQFVHPDDIDRFQKLDVGVSFQPLWSYEDDYITYFTAPRVGAERLSKTYPVNSILKTGAKVAFSSDWPVSSANPLWGIETAVTRTDPFSNSGAPFNPDQRVSLEAAISAYTIDAAALNILDETTGSIEVGKHADLVVLDQNLFEIPVADISDAKVLVTIFNGESVFGDLGDL